MKGNLHCKKNWLWLKSKSIIIIYHILMKKSCLYFDKKYKCASFVVHYKGLTLSVESRVKINESIKPSYLRHDSRDCLTDVADDQVQALVEIFYLGRLGFCVPGCLAPTVTFKIHHQPITIFDD